ncbi:MULTISPECIES: class I adenylate-forming enzyme family protein [unclassified Sphingomonas]|uniref:class I adenylate-forming enzyme family protein n=1 Tax=unclassified Sphingomonas TaxID=196159 RepID=UPI0006F5918F|nr:MULTISPECIES: class I adenylate-forming enzyme family protein [unclassified Sphingomonas]KQS48051.1 AMP-dependent synthetase [Sphingomonas sp. Leaf198]
MRTELDAAMDSTMAALTAPDGMLALGSAERFGVTLPTIAAAPPALSYYFAHYANEHRDAVFLVSGDERLTFGKVYAAAERTARALVGGYGIAKGDRVGIAMRNSPSWIVLYMGIIMAGGVATLLNGWWQSEELETAIGEVDCALVFADPPRVKRLAQIAGLRSPVVEIDDSRELDAALGAVFAKDDHTADLPLLGPEDHATILFTSGSTGQSKGALSEHRAVVQGIFNYLGQVMMMVGIATAQGNPPVGQPVTLLTIPLFHITGEVPVFLQSFAMGRKLVLMPKWDAGEAMRLIEAEGVTYFVGVPLMSFEILNHPDRANYDLSTVTDFAAGGAPRPVDHVRRIDEEMGGSAPLIGYGLTETNAVGTGNWRGNYLAKPNSAGRPGAPLVDLAILDDAGHSVDQGQRGEVCIRTICNFKEYWNRPDATAAAFTSDGYFRTGDIGYLDEDGYLFIVDRKKDIIIRGGENISCQEVEAALYEHAAVAEAAVFGLADERFGEVPGAVVVTRDGETLTPDDLTAFLHQHIAAFKIPQQIWISEEPLPRLGTEKIDKVSLKATYRALV